MSTIIQQFLKQQKKNELLLSEIKQNNLLSIVAIQAISSTLVWQEREIIDYHNKG